MATQQNILPNQILKNDFVKKSDNFLKTPKTL